MNTFNPCKDCTQVFPKEEGNGINRPPFDQPTMYDHFENFQKYKAAKERDVEIKLRLAEARALKRSYINWQPSNNKEDFNLVRTQDILTRFPLEMKELSNRRSNSYEKELTIADIERIAGGATVANRFNIVNKSDKNEKLIQHDRKAEQVNENVKKTPITEKFTETNGKKLHVETVEIETKQMIASKADRGRKALAISHSPVKCPIGPCNRTIGVTSVLAHFIRDHGDESGVECQEVLSGRRSILVFDINTIHFRTNVCLGLLSYGGIDKFPESRPAVAGICTYNAFIEAPNLHMEAHLPIVIMACLTSWTAALRSKELDDEVTNSEDTSQYLLVLWLASIPTTRPLHCTLTVFDNMMTTARSNIIQVRNLSDSQNPSDFLKKEINYLCLSRSDVLLLTKGASQTLNMEIIIHDYDI